MPRVSTAPPNRLPALCQVSGTLVWPNGQPVQGSLTFVPRQAGKSVNGAFVVPGLVQTVADQRGAFTVTLAPSRLVGAYTVRTPAGALVIEVPETATAEFADLVVYRRA